MTKTITKLASAAALTCLMAGAGSASTITADYSTGPGVGANITSSSQGPINTTASVFEMDPTVGDDFLAFCVDLANFVADGVTYTVTTLASSGFSATVINDIDRLFTSFYGTLGSDNTKNAGFQLALWEIIDELAGNTYDLSSGQFVATSAALTQGQYFLDNLGTDTGGYKLTYYDVTGNQSLLGASPVPLPAGLPLLLTAFGGLALVRRKRQKA